MLEQRVRRRITEIHIVHIPAFAAGRLLEHHHQHEALELQPDAALVGLRTVAGQFGMVGQEGVRLLVLVQLVAILNAEQGIGADENAGGVVRAVDAIDGRGGWQ